jgi:translation initiation factor 4G
VLLQHELARARAEGYTRAQISFLIGNAPAERAYIKAGFRFAEERRAAEFQTAISSPGLWRLSRNV